MNKIRVLPEILANKIAAGEIVERPASVVKELLENSLDARCRSIHISIVSGGKRLIQVRDDGEGMNQDDAILAFEHHATSKLQRAEDLDAIATLGFRGEALPSIASVSRLTLKTRSADAAEISGTEIKIQGGVLRSVKPASWDGGTEISVRDLFFNIPARKKFLRSHNTELGHITRLATHYALAHPDIRFTLESEGRMLLDAIPVKEVKERIYQVFGGLFLKNMVEISGQAGSMKASGFCSRPYEQRTNPYSQFFYVNGRMVRDKLIRSAIRQAYRNSMPASAYPAVILFLELPFDKVDVNAHPAKTEIRFRDPNAVHGLVQRTIEQALIGSASVPSFHHHPEPKQFPENAPFAEDSTVRESRSGTGRDAPGFHANAAPSDSVQASLQYPFGGADADLREPPDHSSLQIRPELLLRAPADTKNKFQFDGLRILGQLRDSYIIACDKNGLLIIDQHVAHERILYERIAAAMQKGVVESQGLLVPIALDLAPHQVPLLEKLMPEFNKNGFQVEPFGGTSILIRSVPAIAGDADCLQLVSEILDGLDSEDRTLDVEKIRDRIAVRTACRAAIKINTPLSMEKMQWLLDQLAQTRIPTNCPHGRPILLRFTMQEIERNFGRS
jgi:DNA mismatch repair protein MutL